MEELAELFAKEFEEIKQIFLKNGYSEKDANEKAILYLQLALNKELSKKHPLINKKIKESEEK